LLGKNNGQVRRICGEREVWKSDNEKRDDIRTLFLKRENGLRSVGPKEKQRVNRGVKMDERGGGG